ncbi:MAG: transglycosylase domain-containing protein [Hyphomicrobiaceae bacterium]
MYDWLSRQKAHKRVIDWLGIDSWIDSSLAAAWETTKERLAAASTFFARFRLYGWKRVLNEAASECLTLGTGGLMVLYVLAIPAIMEFDESRITTGKYSVTFLDRNGNEIGKRGILHSDAVPLEEIPDYLIKATLATEDRRFYDHYGVDVIGTLRALVENLRANEVVQGGSTLTQQLAKNLFLSSERSLQRKIKEAFLALLLEMRYSKREILKLYLDRAYMGGGAFGVEAAAEFYFNKSVRDVTLAEAAMMAGLFKAPTKYAPHINLPAARARANEVLTNLVEAGYMTAGQVLPARLEPARPIESRQSTTAEWFLDWAFEQIPLVAEGRGSYVLTARTTVDLDLQKKAEEALTSTIRQYGRHQNAKTGALVSMDPDGAVRAIVGGMDYGESQFNRATQARRQPGSSFKLYVYATALENGYTPNSIVRDASRACGNWHPQNYSGGHGGGGAMPLWMAFAKSLNTTAAELSFAVGREKVIEMTQRLGVKGVRKTCSMALGDTGITPLEHTAAYAHFANGGKEVHPYAISELYNSKGELIYSHDRDEPAPRQVVTRKVVEGMNFLMAKVVTEGTGKNAALDFTTVVGKTGTSSNYRDAWFMGFTGALVTGVWIGNDEFRPMAQVTGGSIPAIAWRSYMSVAHASMNIPQIPGLPPHPAQVAELQRLAELKKTDPGLAAAQAAQADTKSQSLMSDKARDVLKRLADAMRKLEPAGTTDDGAKAVPGTAPGQQKPPAQRTDRRADAAQPPRPRP